MTDSGESNKALNRSEYLLTEILRFVDSLPGIFPLKGNIKQGLDDVRDVIQGLRPPRIMVIGRSRAGKSSLINAICGLKVAEVSDNKPETGKAEWKNYYHNGTDLLHILDTRGLQESTAPRQNDSAATPYDSIMQAVKKECPDVILVLCKATEVHAAAQEDLNICESIHKEIKDKCLRALPVIWVLTKCDEVAPPQVSLPTDNERKNRNILEEVQDFRAYLSERGGLRPHVNAVVPTVAYAEYQEGRNGLILPDEDYRWNITELIQTVIKCTPKEIRGSWARMAQLKEFQLTVANTVVNACAALAGFVSANPIPGSAIPAVGVLQTFMVMYIGWLGGHEFSEQTLKDFAITWGVSIGANAGMIGIADIALKFVPGFGSLISASAGAIATKGLGDTAITYFIKKKSENWRAMKLQFS